jgi:glutathione peroxidase
MIMMKKIKTVFLTAFLTMVACMAQSPSSAAETTSAHQFSFKTLDGAGTINLADYKGKAVLVVNTASKCGFTSQYEGLEKLWQDYKDKGLVVIGAPSSDFGGQEFGSAEEIVEFCKLNYGVSFPMTAKLKVTGDEADPFYQWAGKQVGILSRPKWNFHKYLLDKNGALVDSFGSMTKPQDADLLKAIEKALQ